MNTSYDMVNYNATQHVAHSQDKKSLRPIRSYIIQLICHLLQVVIVISQQLEMLYQDIRQSLRHIKQDITGNDVIFYHKNSVKNIRIKTPKFYQVKQGLFLVYRAFNLTLFFMNFDVEKRAIFRDFHCKYQMQAHPKKATSIHCLIYVNLSEK